MTAAPQTALSSLETLFDATEGKGLPLPPELANLYGPLRFPLRSGRPYVFANFVATLDGVVSLGVPGKAGGREISGSNPHDRMVMGLLRAAADAVIVGAGTLREAPHHRWTADYAHPPLAGAYQSLRTSLGKREPPLNVVVTARGEIDLDLPVFRSGEVSALIVTTTEGARRIDPGRLPPWVQIAAAAESSPLGVPAILGAVDRVRPSDLILVEAGPRLMGDFLAAGSLDDLFLTLAPQVAGRDGTVERPGHVAGKSFAPEHPVWSRLVGVKRGGSHLFLRYAFAAAEQPLASDTRR